MGSTGAVRSLSTTRTATNEPPIRGDVDFATMMSIDASSISFSKIVTILPKGGALFTGRKKDLGELLDRAGIKEAVMHTHRDRAGANDLKRMKDLGFEIIAQHLPEADPSSSIPPIDYYYMRKK